MSKFSDRRHTLGTPGVVPAQFRTLNQGTGAKYDSQKFNTYLDNPFIANSNGPEAVKNFKNILKLNKIVNTVTTDVTPRIIKTAGHG